LGFIRASQTVQENQAKSPDFKVQARTKKFPHGEWLYVGIAPIPVQSSNNKCTFPFVQEPPGFMSLVGEVNEENEAKNGNDRSQLSTVLEVFS
jgi:hypothetical protein